MAFYHIMRRVMLCLLAGILAAGGAIHAQDDTTNDPVDVVAFVIEGRDGLDTAPLFENVDDSVTRLRSQFQALGATTRSITLDRPIPSDIELVVLVRPRRLLDAQKTAYLWTHLQNGGHLLLALDPNGHNGIRAEPGRGGLSQLLDAEYGVRLNDDLLIDEWFSIPILADLVTSWSSVEPEPFLPHPITDPIMAYDLPLRIWGGRSIEVAGITTTAETNALIITEDQYGETGRINFRAEDSSALQLNIGADNQGRLLLGAISTHTTTGSRIAVMGDSEFFQDIYGQTRSPDDQTQPRFLGNTIFTERLAAWLMGISVEDWPSMPSGYTWIALDGSAADWPENIVTYIDDDEPGETIIADYDIQQMQMLHNDRYAYLFIELRGTWDRNTQLVMNFTTDAGSQMLTATESMIMLDDRIIEDASLITSPDIEIRLPLRVIGVDPVLESICIQSSFISVTDCLQQVIVSTLVSTIDPVPMRFTDAPSAFTRDVSNLRAEPTTESAIVTAFNGWTQLNVVGRNEDGEWIRVRDGRSEGWIASFLLVVNVDIESLPVVDDLVG